MIMEAANLISVTVLVALTAMMTVSAFTVGGNRRTRSKPTQHGENMQTPHRKVLGSDFWLSVPQKNYQGELHGVVTMEWYANSTRGGMDLSRVEITCMHSGHHEYVYHRRKDGVENIRFQNKHFNKRVEVNLDALRQGKIEVTIVNLTSEAAGCYKCVVLKADRKRWDNLTLNITPTEGSSSSEGGSLGNELVDSQGQQRHHRYSLMGLTFFLLTVFTLGALVKWKEKIFGTFLSRSPDL